MLKSMSTPGTGFDHSELENVPFSALMGREGDPHCAPGVLRPGFDLAPHYDVGPGVDWGRYDIRTSVDGVDLG